MNGEILTGIRDIIVENNFIWIISDLFDCLFKYDFISNKLEYVTSYPEEIALKKFAFNKIIKIKNDIYFIPRLADSIYCYNLIENKWYKFEISMKNIEDKKNIQVVVYADFLYCLNRFPDFLMKINLLTKKMDIFYFGNSEYLNHLVESKIYCSYKSSCVFKDHLIWATNNDLLNFWDLENEEFYVKKINGLQKDKIKYSEHIFEGGLEDWIIDLKVFKDKLWIFTFEGKVYQYDNGEVILCDCFKHHNIRKNKKLILPIWTDIVLLNDEIICIPQYKSYCIKYDANNQYKKIFDCYEENWNEDIREYSLCKVLNNQKVLLFSYFENIFYILDLMNNTVCRKTIEVPIDDFIMKNNRFKIHWIKDNIFVFDNLNFLCKNKIIHGENKENNIFVGKKIYRNIKRV